MKRIIRLTESDLRGIIQRSVNRVLREQDDTFLLQDIAQSISEMDDKYLYAKPGENELDVFLSNGDSVYLKYNVMSNPYTKKGEMTRDYYMPDEIEDEWDVDIYEMICYDSDGNGRNINDNGIVKNTLKNSLIIDYSEYDVPNEEEFWYYED